MKATSVYTIDLSKINGKGDFPCPRCGTTISPDDDTEETYTIIEPKVNSQGLSEIIIRCNKCTTHIQLTGFSLLQQTIPTHKDKPKAQRKKETCCYITHI
jgi:predicted RNA-binding Zn-ribbon protein involved in translation (DUF1610 family)